MSPFQQNTVVALLVPMVLRCLSFAVADDPVDWYRWRGPEMNGSSRELNLPSDWSPKGKNLLWRKEEYGTRCTPIAMNGKLYFIARHKPETTEEGERVVCIDAKSGDLIWESVHNIFLSDAPAERVGWAACVGDPETGNVYALGIGCILKCLNGETGEVIWQRSMLEEYGMLSTYGGRTNFPEIFENMLIISGVMTQWGEHAVPAHRFLALDKKTGEPIWFSSTRPRPEDTTYSTPVFTTFNGQAAMLFGAADGALYAVQPRTGKVIWKYQASPRGFNVSPLVVGSKVYCAFGEKSQADTTILGGIFALDGNRTGLIAEDQLLWKINAQVVSRCSPVHHNGFIYLVDDGGALLGINAETGKIVHKQKVGRIMFGSLALGDGKIYCAETTGNVWIFEPGADGKLKQLSRQRLGNGEEIYSSPIIADGRVYFASFDAMYCIGTEGTEPSATAMPAPPAETPAGKDDKVAHIQVVPVESLLDAKQDVAYRVLGFNARGQSLGTVDAKLELVGSGSLSGNRYSAPAEGHHVVSVTAKLGELTSTARARIVPPLPWKFDFNDGKVPPTWIGADYRHQPFDLAGEKCLVKIQTIPKGTRSQLWMGQWNHHNYTVQADVFSTGEGDVKADMGIVNQRYTFDVMAKDQLQIRSWTPRLELRFAKTVPYVWESNQWYTVKFRSESTPGGVTLRGKIWKRGEAEPSQWDIEATDATPNTMGSPGLFGNSSTTPFYIDNVEVYPNK
jgi:outer membrane protein assembly factor BamB